MQNEKDRTDILLVDDEDTVRAVLRRTLEEAGLSVVTTSNGKDALELFQAHKPRIVISDIKMPSMNGFELIHKIKHSRSALEDTKYLIITALSFSEMEEAAQKIGVSDFIGKPIDLNIFRKRILHLLSEDGQGDGAATAMGKGQELPQRAQSETYLRELIGATDRPIPLGQVFCIGVDDIRKRVGEGKWKRLKDRVGKLIVDAVQKVCRRDDVFLECPDGSVLIVFAGSDQLRSQAAVTKAARMVNEALFGSEDYAGAEIRSFVQMAGGEHGQSASDILDTLLTRAKMVSVGAEAKSDDKKRRDAPAPSKSVPPKSPAPVTETPNVASDNAGRAQAGIPSFRSALLDRFRAVAESPIEFRFLPILNVQRRKIDMFICLPSRKAVSRTGRTWGYGVLGNTPSSADICDLDIAGLELGLMSMMDHLGSGRMVSICPCLHFETLGSKKNREKVISLLGMIPGDLRSLIYPIVMQIPDGIMESRLTELIGPVRSHVNFLAAEVFPQKASTDLMRSISRLRAGGIECILINLPRDHSDKDVQAAQQIGSRITAQGGKVGVTGIRTPETLIELAYSSMEYCAGPAVGSPYEAMPEPVVFDPKKLEA